MPAPRRLLAEFLGTGLLVAVVVGSGIAAQQLSPDQGVELLANSVATVFGLGVLILLLAPVSGAHFNPVVSYVDALVGPDHDPSTAGRRLIGASLLGVVQTIGAAVGAVLANVMYGLAPVQVSAHERVNGGHLVAEVVATAGLVLVILGLVRAGRSELVIAPAVACYIGAAYWFTSSTSFANPAVTVGRVLSDTFAGIAPGSVLPFVGAQVFGGVVGVVLAGLLFPRGADPVPRSVVEHVREGGLP